MTAQRRRVRSHGFKLPAQTLGLPLKTPDVAGAGFQLLLERRVSLSRRGQVCRRTHLRVLMCGIDLAQSVLHRGTNRHGPCQSVSHLRLPASQLHGGRAHLGPPVSSGRIERRRRIGQLLIDSRTVGHRRLTLCHDTRQTGGQGRELCCILLVRVVPRDVRRGQTCLNCDAVGRFLAEPTLETDVSRRRVSQIPCGPFSRSLMRSLGDLQVFLDLGADRDRLRQRTIEFRLAPHQLQGGRSEVGLPVSSGRLERRRRIGQLLIDGRTVGHRRLTFCHNTRQTGSQRRELRCMLLVSVLP